ncbi:MAG: class I SAM-dependent methyltransferase [Caldilinea sp.]
MVAEDRTRWNRRYLSGDAPIEPKPNRWLTKHKQVIDYVAAERRKRGAAPASLDVACGAGGTVLWFARRGWRATGVDVSDEALALANTAAERIDVAGCVHLIHADLDTWRPPADAFDCVTCFYFLDRQLWPYLRAAVRPGGVLAMQTHHRGILTVRPKSTLEYLLAPDELIDLVAGWGWTLLATSDPASAATSEAVLAQRPVV